MEVKSESGQPIDTPMNEQDENLLQSQHLAGDHPNADAEDPVRVWIDFHQLRFNKSNHLKLIMHILSAYQELVAIKARVREMEEEAAKLKQIQEAVTQQIEMNTSQEYGEFFISFWLDWFCDVDFGFFCSS